MKAAGIRSSLKAYLASLAAMGKLRLAGLTVLVIVGALVEGLGVVLLIPLSSLMFGWKVPDGRLEHLSAQLLETFGRGTGLALLLGGFIVLMSLRGIILYLREMRLYKLSSELVDRWRARMISALVHAEWRQLRGLNRGEVEFAVTGDVGRLSIGSDQLLRGVVAGLQLAVLIVFAVRLAPVLVLAVVALLIPALPVAAWATRSAYAYGEVLTRRGGNRQSAFGQFMAGMKLAKAHRAEDRYADEFVALSTDMRLSGLAYMATRLRGKAAFELLAAVLAAGLLWLGILILRIEPAVLGAVLVLFVRMPGPALALAQGAQAFAMLLPAIQNLQRLEASLAAEPVALPAGPAPAGPAHIELKSASLWHDPQRPLLTGIDLEIPAGQLVVLLGPSGSGKTSFADALIGLVPLDAGIMLVNGEPVSTAQARAGWRSRIAYVQQDPFLFDASVAENLRWAVPEASDADLWAAIEAAGALDFMAALPEGLDAMAGERGSRFSGGERQRLCMARALLFSPSLLVLDEATSALDTESEERLLKVVGDLRGKVTVLMITHRLSDRISPDRIIRLHDGRLIES